MQNINDLILKIADGERAAHAFICEGRSGERRRVFLDTLAAGLVCTSSDRRIRPCGECPACRQAAAGTNMDIVRMNKSVSSGKSGRESYKTEDAAAFIERLSMGSYGRCLIGIIDDADSLSETIQNKLLKTLEEPSQNTLILLGVSNRDNMLSTVRSRCSDVRISDYLDENGPDADHESRNTQALDDLAEMVSGRQVPFCEFRSALDKAVRSREDALLFLDRFEKMLRDNMIAAGGSEAAAEYAEAIECINVARMDIRREMNHSRALKRLYLEL